MEQGPRSFVHLSDNIGVVFVVFQCKKYNRKKNVSTKTFTTLIRFILALEISMCLVIKETEIEKGLRI